MEEAKAAKKKKKKRPLDSNAHSNYFKIRAFIRYLRPHFLQVLQTPDYKNCKASNEIREELKIVIKLYENMKAYGHMKVGQNMDHNHKAQKEQQPLQSFARHSEIKLTPPVPEDGQAQGTYVVGGSAFGWNFITFSGKEPLYYGRTKENFRSGKVTE